MSYSDWHSLTSFSETGVANLLAFDVDSSLVHSVFFLGRDSLSFFLGGVGGLAILREQSQGPVLLRSLLPSRFPNQVCWHTSDPIFSWIYSLLLVLLPFSAVLEARQ